MTQSERIVRHLEAFGSITSLEAMSDYGIMRLASRVSDLKKTACRYGLNSCVVRTALANRPVMHGISSKKKRGRECGRG